MDAGDQADVIKAIVITIADNIAFVAQALAHFMIKLAGIDKLNLALAVSFLLIGDDPDIGADAGIVKKLIRHGDDRFQPVVFDDPSADIGFTTSGITGKERGTIEYDADSATAFLRCAHFGDHVLQKQQGAIIDAG